MVEQRNKKDPHVEASVTCKVSPGMFSTERGVVIELPGGRSIEALVDESQVTVHQDPSPDREVDGRVKVHIVKDRGDSLLVDLPTPGLAHGTRLTVPRELVEVRRS